MSLLYSSHPELVLNDRLLCEKEAARILGMSVAWLQRQRWLKAGPEYIRVGRSVRYRLSTLLRWLDDNRVPPVGPDQGLRHIQQ